MANQPSSYNFAGHLLPCITISDDQSGGGYPLGGLLGLVPSEGLDDLLGAGHELGIKPVLDRLQGSVDCSR